MASLKPPFTLETAIKKVKAAQDLWNTQFAPPLHTIPLSSLTFLTTNKRSHKDCLRLHPRYHLAQPHDLLDRHSGHNQLSNREVSKREIVSSPQRVIRVHRELHRCAVLVRVSGLWGWGEVEAVLRAGGLDVQWGGEDEEEDDVREWLGFGDWWGRPGEVVCGWNWC